MKHIKLYDSNMELLGILENATHKSYKKKLNDIWEASFSLPANDPKAKLCTPFRIIELFDGEERVDLFRILPISRDSNLDSELITFECEHVLATLTDDLLFQCHEKNELSTRDVLLYILGFQATSKWKLGTLDFDYRYSYKWESENLLASLLSVPNIFVDDYQFTWSTTKYPWTINLIRPTDIKTYIRYGRNLKSIKKKVDPTNLCTRMYGLGYGEGINQLTISDINNGLPYIDSDTVNTYGVIRRVFCDSTEEDAASLKAKMQANLNALKNPRIEYTVDAAHIYEITNLSADNFYIGGNCRVVDKEDDLTFTAKIITITKSNIDEENEEASIEIANSPSDITKSLSSLSNRQKIAETYAQGATNLLSQNFADNCDPNYPAIMRFYIPEETVRINKIELNYKTSNFRAYSKAIEGGGGITTTTAAGGATLETSEPGIWHLLPAQYLPPDYMDANGSHDHSVYLSINGTTNIGGDPGHTHTFDCSVDGNVENAGSHAHSMSSVSHEHDINIPNHFHTIIMPDHIHNIQYGIYLNDTIPSFVDVRVDGKLIPELSLNENKINLIPYLQVDGDNKITRGAWHEISITPDSLARIEANIVSQIFIQSRGGGNY
jgi:phage minor structural protein